MQPSRIVQHHTIFVTLVLVVALLLAACAGDAETEVVEEVEEPAVDEVIEEEEAVAEEEAEMAGGELPEVDPFEVEGEINIAGSSTVFPLTEAIAERFIDEGFSGDIPIASIGSGAGFERFCVNAETDIANASRPINAEETEACIENDRVPLEFRVGTDALAIAVSEENDFVDNLTLEQLAQIFSGEAETWADINPEWPEEEIQLYSPGTDSGTFDYFVEVVFDESEEPILSAENIQFSEDDNVLVQGVQASPYAIGYFGYAYYLENEDALRIVNIEGIEPTAEAAESGEYPLSRPLFIYSAPSIIAEEPQVAAFINYYLMNVNDVIDDVGYFPASEVALEDARALLADALDGEVVGQETEPATN
ncbi:MAG: PstS family phosphate ABC transporter substrate-binding protein [Chloroflexota bacterium]|nr:PstS family phosphate ABC transporter substrate-binding protein [Chloroflexota bacterium]